MRKLLVVALIIAAVPLLAGGVAASGAAGRSLPVTWIVVYDPGPRWEAHRAASEQPGVREHGRYLIQLYAEGVMKSAGPFAGGGGLVVFQAESEEAARAIVDADPGVQSGLLTVILLRAWDPRDWDEYVTR